MLRYISKSITVLLTALVVGGCSGTAQTVKENSKAEYHGLYTPSNTASVQKALNTNHPDYDWGLWGHNLGKIIQDDATDDMYAMVDGKRNKKQLCFSSDDLYKAVRSYIIDQYGYGTDEYSERISIMPMDNKMACTCAKCKAKGNTDTNATPAVSYFVSRLANEFPKHNFYTSAYHTTKAVPAKPLPQNVGVFISSVSMQMRIDFSNAKGYTEFVSMVKEWKKKCDRILVWDYERNFDDYLSPFPCLLAMQSRLQLYKKLGVSGVFINGSGDDYSAFDDMQTHVLALLMNNPDTDVRTAVSQYFEECYPHTADVLTNYYWGLESRLKATNHALPLYGTMQDMCESYLDAKEFVRFRSELDAKSKQSTGDERKRLNALLTGFAYTQLEMYRTGILPKDVEMAIEMKEILKGHSELKNMKNRDEVGHTIDDYLKLWK